MLVRILVSSNIKHPDEDLRKINNAKIQLNNDNNRRKQKLIDVQFNPIN